MTIRVEGRNGVPAAGVSAVTLQIGVHNPVSSGWLTAFAANVNRPATAALNFSSGRTASATATVAVSPTGDIKLYNSSPRAVELLVDVAGYYSAGISPASGGFVPVMPSRSLDTRTGIGAAAGDWTIDPTADGRFLSWQLAGRNGIPKGAATAIVSLTATNAAGPGHISAFEDERRNPGYEQLTELTYTPPVRGLAFDAGVPVTNLFVIALPASGKAKINVAGTSTVDAIVDVVGFTMPGGTATTGMYQPMPPSPAATDSVAANSIATVTLPVPAGSTVLLTVNAGSVARSGAIYAFATGIRPPTSAVMTVAAGRSVSASVVVRTSSKSTVNFVNVSPGAIELAVDLLGYYRAAPPAPRTVWSWGDNTDGQLGQSSYSAGSDIPAPVTALASATAVTGSGESAFAIKTDGSLWAWGSNSGDDDAFQGGQLGDGTSTDRPTPVKVHNLSNVTAVVSEGYSTCALQADGTVWSWGENTTGPSGDPSDPITAREPVQVAGLSAVVSLPDCSRAVRSDGTVWTWQANPSAPPQQVAGLSGVRSISGSLVLRTDGQLEVDGQIVPDVSGIVSIGGGYALAADGTVFTSTGTKVTGISTVTAIGAGYAVTATGALWRLNGATAAYRVQNVPAVVGVASSGTYLITK